MFVSTYEGAIDVKGRVSVPAPFRAALGGGSRVFLWPALDGSKCLQGGGEALMRVYQQTIARLPLQSMARKVLTTTIISRSEDLKMDDPGRIKIPEKMLKSVGIDKNLLFVGALESFQIWAPDAYAEHEAAMAEAALDPSIVNALVEPYNAAMEAGDVPGLGPVGGGE